MPDRFVRDEETADALRAALERLSDREK